MIPRTFNILPKVTARASRRKKILVVHPLVADHLVQLSDRHRSAEDIIKELDLRRRMLVVDQLPYKLTPDVVFCSPHVDLHAPWFRVRKMETWLLLWAELGYACASGMDRDAHRGECRGVVFKMCLISITVKRDRVGNVGSRDGWGIARSPSCCSLVGWVCDWDGGVLDLVCHDKVFSAQSVVLARLHSTCGFMDFVWLLPSIQQMNSPAAHMPPRMG